jgi:hypothetical protein
MGFAHGIFIAQISWNLWLTSTTIYLGFLERGTHSSSTFMTIVSSKAFGSTTNISSEIDCNSGAWGKVFCSPMLFDSSTFKKTRLEVGGGMWPSMGIQKTKKIFKFEIAW